MTNNEKYLVVGAGNISKKHIDNIKRLKRKAWYSICLLQVEILILNLIMQIIY